ncbi:MAG: Sec-independent protein translocase protein TatB [Rhodobacterales bacterium]
MFDMGWTELLLIGIVALIVVGPKELPMLFRNVGRFVGKARGMAREFSRAMEDAADESGVRDVAKSLKSVADPKKMGLDKIREATDEFKSWKPGSETAKLAQDRADAAAKLRAQTTDKALAAKSADVKAEATRAADASVAPKSASAPAAKPKPAAAKNVAQTKPAAKAAKPASGAKTAGAAKAAPPSGAKKAPAKKTPVEKKPAQKKPAKKSADPQAQE